MEKSHEVLKKIDSLLSENTLTLAMPDEIAIIKKIREISKRKNAIFIENDILSILDAYDAFCAEEQAKTKSRVAIYWSVTELKNAFKIAQGRQFTKNKGGRKSRINKIQEAIRNEGFNLFNPENAEILQHYLERDFSKSTIYEALRTLGEDKIEQTETESN